MVEVEVEAAFMVEGHESLKVGLVCFLNAVNILLDLENIPCSQSSSSEEYAGRPNKVTGGEAGLLAGGVLLAAERAVSLIVLSLLTFVVDPVRSGTVLTLRSASSERKSV